MDSEFPDKECGDGRRAFQPSRRTLLRAALAGGVVTTLGGNRLHASAASALGGGRSPSASNVIILGLGGGVRFSETFGDPKHRLIPETWGRIRPRGTYFSNIWGKGALDHSVGNKNLLSGRWSKSQADVAYRASLFEHYRKATGADARSTWCAVWGSDVGNHFLGFSLQPGYGPDYGALMSHPRSLMEWWKKAKKEGMKVEEPDIPFVGYTRRVFPYAPADEEIREDLYDLISDTPEFQDTGLDLGQDATLWEQDMNRLLIRRVLTRYQPRVVFLGFCSMDVAHESGFDEYCDGIAAADRAIAEVFDVVESEPFYKGKTMVVITPEIGRDQGDDPAQPVSYQQHTGDTEETNHRHGMVVYGPGIKAGHQVDRRVEQIDILPTIARVLDFPIQGVDGKVLEDALV